MCEIPKTTSQSKYKQLTRASLNLTDNVLRNNMAYFGWTASKLTETLSLPDILPGRSAAPEESGTGKGGVRREKQNNQEGPPHKPSSKHLFVKSFGCEKLNGVRRGLGRDWQLEDIYGSLDF